MTFNMLKLDITTWRIGPNADARCSDNLPTALLPTRQLTDPDIIPIALTDDNLPTINLPTAIKTFLTWSSCWTVGLSIYICIYLYPDARQNNFYCCLIFKTTENNNGGNADDNLDDVDGERTFPESAGLTGTPDPDPEGFDGQRPATVVERRAPPTRRTKHGQCYKTFFLVK